MRGITRASFGAGHHRLARRGLGRWVGALGAVAAMVALQGSPAAVATPRATTSATPSVPPSARGASVVISSRGTSVGRVLVDASGFSLYGFSGDGSSAALGCLPTNVAPNGTKCTDAWPPVMATGPLVAGPGVNQHGLGHMKRPGIESQVTYFGQPLYRFVADGAPGDTKGEDVTSFMGFWRLVSTAGIPAADRASVRLELSGNGPVLDTPAAFGSTRSLYHLSLDPPRGATCTAACAAFWPPLLTDTQPSAGLGVNPTLLGVLRRSDGSLQVTYSGKALYLFAFDLGAGQPSGQTNGNNLIDPPASGVWNNLSADGLPTPGASTVGTEPSGTKSILATPATVGGGTTATLYAFTADTTTKSNCVGACARFWPPLLTTQAPVAGAGADATLLGTIQRADGSFQVTYNSHPLYLFAFGLDPGTSGEGVNAFGGTFQVLSPSGMPG
jgi:predicted lipoprotein with Yx(FWY)xxD motif